MEALRSIYYDLDELDYGPKPGDFLVSIGKKGIGSVYHIAESNKSKNRNRYNLKVFVATDLKAKTRIEVQRRWVRRRGRWMPAKTPPLAKWGIKKQWRVTVCGAHAWLLFWYSRSKK